MAIAAPFFPADRRGFFDWFADFLRSELAPYPGRGAIVARMVISATITTILIMTWRIPNGAIGPFYAFLISRENLGSTAKSALSIVVAFGLGALFIPIGAPMFASIPLTHFVWEAVSIFLIFFLIHTLSEFGVAGGIGVMASSVLAIWYLPGPAEMNVERTLWQVVSPALGAAITLAVEAVFRAFHTEDELISGLDGRLGAVEALLRSQADGSPLPQRVRDRLAQYAMVGASRLRRMIVHASLRGESRMKGTPAQMTAVISLTARAVDYAAAMIQSYPEFSATDRQIAANVADQIAEIRRAFGEGRSPENLHAGRIASGLPLLRETEAMVELIPRVFEGSLSLDAFQVPTQPTSENRIFVRDAFTNPEHIRYALSGCLAGMLCYILYVALAWPGLSVSVTTCVFTALVSFNVSRQKQALRLAGALIGGFVFGLGAQIFILPYIDSITGFALLIAAVTAIAAWIATASPRLGYCGVQLAFAFYFVHVNDFRIQTSLSISRDRSLGVLLGIGAMWLVFERFHPTTPARQMIETFNSNLRLLAELSMADAHIADAKGIANIRSLRDKIYANFSSVNDQADAVPFEIGSGRVKHMAARDHIRRWQAMLRTLYLLQLALLQARIFGTAGPPTEQERAALANIDQASARILQEMAAYLEAQQKGELPGQPAAIERPLFSPEQPEEGSLLGIAHEVARILDRIRAEMLATPLFSNG